MEPKYPLPKFLKGKVEQKKYNRWLDRKAKAHCRRDRKRWGRQIVPSEYKQAIQEAVWNSEGLDFYTRERLEWSLIGEYDNDRAEKEGIEYRKDIALLPTVDHEDPEAQEPVFRICGMQTNDCRAI